MNSQKEMILEHLQTSGSITPLEALRLFGCFRLGARIWDLKNEGYNITADLTEVNGKRFCEYRLKPQAAQTQLFGDKS